MVASKELAMNIVYAAEKPSIAAILSDYIKHEVAPADINITANPDKTGSFFIRWQLGRFILSPDGKVEATGLHRID